MKLRDYITASLRPVGEPKMLGKARVYACELGPYWRDIKANVVAEQSNISVEAFKAYWANRFEAGEVQYPNIFWVEPCDFVERNIFRDEVGEHFIRLKKGWAPVLSSLKLGKLACFRRPEEQPSISKECGLVYVYPWSEEYGERI